MTPRRQYESDDQENIRSNSNTIGSAVKVSIYIVETIYKPLLVGANRVRAKRFKVEMETNNCEPYKWISNFF